MKRAYFIKDLITEREYEILRKATGSWHDYYVKDNGKASMRDEAHEQGTVGYQVSPIEKIDTFIGKLICERYGIEFGQHVFIRSTAGTHAVSHKDHSKRNTILTFPLFKGITKTFIGYADSEGKEVVQEFDYDRACLFNTRDWHGARQDEGNPQIIYQLCTSQMPEDVIEILRERNLIEEDV